MAEVQIENKGRGRPKKANNKRPIEITPPVVPANPLQLIHLETNEEGESTAKRGRGRPKGSTKPNQFSKKPPVPGRGRGRPKGSTKPNQFSNQPPVPGRVRGRPKNNEDEEVIKSSEVEI